MEYTLIFNQKLVTVSNKADLMAQIMDSCSKSNNAIVNDT